VAHPCHPSYAQKHKQDCELSGLGLYNVSPYLKNDQSKKGGGMAVVVECLPRKCKTLSQPQVLQKRKRKKERKRNRKS
jgi:hypothetical protein